jgi:hypothetical protein
MPLLLMSQFEQDLWRLAPVMPGLFFETGFEGLFKDLDSDGRIRNSI